MEYISAEEFLKQPIKVQKVFLDWWKPSNGDIFAFLGDDTSRKIGVLGDGEDIKITTKGKGEYRLPLFTEGQLRKFIEYKTKGELEHNIHNWEGEILIKILDEQGYKTIKEIATDETDLLQAYWQVACEVAKESEVHE